MKTFIQSSQQRHLQEPGWNGVLFDNAPVVTNKTQSKKTRVYLKHDYEERGTNAKPR